MGEGIGEYSSLLLLLLWGWSSLSMWISSVVVGEGCPQPKKLLSLEEPSGDLTGEMGGDLGKGLLRLDDVLVALSGGLSVVRDACWMSEFGRSRSRC